MKIVIAVALVLLVWLLAYRADRGAEREHMQSLEAFTRGRVVAYGGHLALEIVSGRQSIEDAVERFCNKYDQRETAAVRRMFARRVVEGGFIVGTFGPDGVAGTSDDFIRYWPLDG